MQKNFDGIDIFFIIIISIYFIILIVFITLYLRKHLKENEKIDNTELMLEQTIKSDLLKKEIENKINPPKQSNKNVKKKKKSKKNTRSNAKKKTKKKR